MNCSTRLARSLLHLVFWSFVCLCFLIPLKTTLNSYDEGFAIVNAVRILRGEVPYRDFWMLYPPGQSYVLALFFAVFGKGLLVERLYDTLIRVGVVTLSYKIVRTHAPFGIAALVGGSITLLLASIGFYAYAFFPALFLSLLTLWCVQRFFYVNTLSWLRRAGIILGLCSFFRWDVGLYTALSMGISLLFQKRELVPHELLRKERILIHFFIPAVVVSLLLYGSIGVIAGWEELWRQAGITPLTIHRVARWKPYPTLNTLLGTGVYSNEFNTWDYLMLYSPYGVCFGSLGVLLLQKKVAQSTAPETVGVSLLGFSLSAQAFSRFDFLHCLPFMLLSLIVAGMQWPLFRKNKLASSLLIVMLILLSLQVKHFSWDSLKKTVSERPFWSCHSSLPLAQCVHLDSDQEETVKYLTAHMEPSAPLYIGAKRHDKIFVSDLGTYFLVDRPPATFHSELYPGVTTTLEGQKRIINDLERTTIQWVVVVAVPESSEPNVSAVSSEVYLLDDFLQQNFRSVAQFGRYDIRIRSVVSPHSS